MKNKNKKTIRRLRIKNKYMDMDAPIKIKNPECPKCGGNFSDIMFEAWAYCTENHTKKNFLETFNIRVPTHDFDDHAPFLRCYLCGINWKGEVEVKDTKDEPTTHTLPDYPVGTCKQPD